IYFHIQLHCDRHAVFLRGVKFPLLYRFNGLLVEAHTQAAGNLDVFGSAIRTDDQPQDHDTLVFRFARFFGVLRVRLEENSWSGDAAADAINAAAKIPAATRSNAGANARADA